MSEQEKSALNRRVAVAIGSEKVVKFIDPTTNEPCASFWLPLGESDNGVLPPVPGFCTDPDAAELLLQEIERRGWVWSIGPHMSANEGGEKYFSCVSGGSYRCSKPPYGMSGGETWAEALCLAFLSAVTEAEKTPEVKP